MKTQSLPKGKSVSAVMHGYHATRRDKPSERTRVATDIDSMTTPEVLGRLYERHELPIWKALAVCFIALSTYALFFK